MISAALLVKLTGIGNKDPTDEWVVGNVQEKGV